MIEEEEDALLSNDGGNYSPHLRINDLNSSNTAGNQYMLKRNNLMKNV